MIQHIGITERGDAALDLDWMPWIRERKPAILITKDPAKLDQILRDHNLSGANIIVHCTITGHGSTVLEPNAPGPAAALEGVHNLLGMLGPARIVIRIDPIIPTRKGTEAAVLVATKAGPHRVRISFIDNYPHLQRRFEQAGLPPLPWTGLHAPIATRIGALAAINISVGRPVEICGEPDMDCAGCVSTIDCETLGVKPATNTSRQRTACACLANKKELLTKRNQCQHGCLYCYWKD